MNIPFVKMHANGNDFVIIDNRTKKLLFDASQIFLLSNRNTGIGFDQLILLENSTSSGSDVLMKIYNCENHHLITAHSLGRDNLSWNKRFVKSACLPDQPDSETGQKLIQFPQKVSFAIFLFSINTVIVHLKCIEVHNHKDGAIKRLIDYTNSFC